MKHFIVVSAWSQTPGAARGDVCTLNSIFGEEIHWDFYTARRSERCDARLAPGSCIPASEGWDFPFFLGSNLPTPLKPICQGSTKNPKSQPGTSVHAKDQPQMLLPFSYAGKWIFQHSKGAVWESHRPSESTNTAGTVLPARHVPKGINPRSSIMWRSTGKRTTDRANQGLFPSQP